MKYTEHIQEFYDKNGKMQYVLISAELFAKLQPAISKIVTNKREQPEKPEPINDWDTLLQFWDFQYPADYDVACGCCGSATENWQNDDPRKFKLVAASLGGLVTFTCQNCKAKIMKRHFKDEIAVECTPFHEEKSRKKEALHD